MRVWIAKHWQTEGIKSRDVESTGAAEMVVDRTTNYPQYFHGEGKDWHRTQESAAAFAAAQRDKRIASLKKQIKRLKQMEFGNGVL